MYLLFLGLTLLNPATVVYFLSLAIGAAMHARLTPRMELATTLLSSAILVGFALKIAADALASPRRAATRRTSANSG